MGDCEPGLLSKKLLLQLISAENSHESVTGRISKCRLPTAQSRRRPQYAPDMSEEYKAGCSLRSKGSRFSACSHDEQTRMRWTELVNKPRSF